jgi:hypothetical protein
MHPDQYPHQPDGWPASRRSPLLVFSAGFFLLLAAGAVAGAAWAATSGDAAGVVLMVAGALVTAHLAGLAFSLIRRPGPAGSPGVTADGLTFSYAAGPYYWLIALLVLTVLLLAGIGVVAAAGSSAGGWLVAAVCALLAIFLAWFLVVVLRLAPGRIVLTAEGILHRSLTFEHFVPWFAVYDVVAEPAETPLLVVKAHPSDGTRLRRHTGRLGAYESQFLPFLVARAYWLGGNAVPAYRALAYYFHNAERRAGLGSEAGAR